MQLYGNHKMLLYGVIDAKQQFGGSSRIGIFYLPPWAQPKLDRVNFWPFFFLSGWGWVDTFYILLTNEADPSCESSLAIQPA